MKTLLLCLMASFAILIISCSSAKYTVSKDDTNKTVINGKISWSNWQKEAGWQSDSADDYTPKLFYVEKIKEIMANENVRFVMFSGSWCGDSKNEVPKFFKIIADMHLLKNYVELYGIDRNKNDQDGIAQSLKIEKVPTLVIYRGGKEKGRIVEFPIKSWEEDIFDILMLE